MISYDTASLGLGTRDEVELIANKVLAPVSYILGRESSACSKFYEKKYRIDEKGKRFSS